MAIIKIRGRKETITVDNMRGRKIKIARFGDIDGRGKMDPKTDLDLGDDWAGTIGQIEWVEIGKDAKKKEFKVIRRLDTKDRVFMVPIDYVLKSGEELA